MNQSREKSGKERRRRVGKKLETAMMLLKRNDQPERKRERKLKKREREKKKEKTQTR